MANNKQSIAEIPVPITFHAENELIGSLICNPSYVTEARKLLSDESFAEDNNKKIWRRLVDNDNSSDPMTENELMMKCNSEHFQKMILPYCKGTMTVGEVFTRINTLAKAVLCRNAYFTAFNMLRTSSEGKAESAISLARDFTKDMESLISDKETRHIKDAVNDLAEILAKRQASALKGKPLRVHTSFERLDWYTYGGLAKGNLVILAARPSVGKTAIMLQMAREAACSGEPAWVFSLEMTNAELVQRLVRANTDMTQYDMAQGHIDWGKFEKATQPIANIPLYLNDSSTYFDDICTKILTASRKGECGIVFIDYLGLIDYRDSRSTKLYEQISDATKKLKRLAKECNIPIVLLCQLNRDTSKEGREPQLHDLRDSGSIEQDADIVLMLSRTISADYEDARRINLHIRKNRQGEAGHTIGLYADDSFSNFAEITVDGNPIRV